MPAKTIPPTLGARSFSCPHCGAISDQNWNMAYIKWYEKEKPPFVPDAVEVERFKIETSADTEGHDELIKYLERKASKVLFDQTAGEYVSVKREMANLTLSQCYSCNEWSVWIADNLIYPNNPTTVELNEEMPPEIRLDFKEAADIVDRSPRGAAALLRLCIQKLMVQLGLPGKRIEDDIAELVKRGLDTRIQRALDIVRVIGNKAVHPGTVDLRDDKATATELFTLVDLIVETMIAQPKHIERVYDALPQGARDAIEKRDKNG